MTGFCRDCLQDLPDRAIRCPGCGSPRVVRHAEIDRLAIAHVDCDAFYAAVEKRDDPSLNDKPVIIGGGRRGVVATACYIARTFGVKSAMPMFEARRLCPHATVVPPDMAKYVRVGREVRALMLDLTPLVEPLSIDEAFLDLSGTERLHGRSPARSLARFARAVEDEIGITVSIGLSENKFLAKLASDLDKPRGFSVLGQREAAAFLAPKPVTFIWGVGKQMGAALAHEGFRTIADLQRATETDLMRRFGTEGLRLARLARGIDARQVSPERETKSVSAETTFETDIAAFRTLERRLWGLSEKVSARLKAKEIAGATITLKLKTADFRLRTRARSLAAPTQLAAKIFAAGRDLLEREAQGTRFRLIGIGVSALGSPADADPADLVDPQGQRSKAAEQAVDRLRAKFGRDAVVKGLALDDE
ncbi:MAG: polymerase [Alphaproteobacteria bacterium]|jgi:DNA polymerase-4|nr:polymerase [Alphaproteobacteria bacterium]MEA3021282.1 polymerase [Alphaproteobacteria bacterium]